MNNSTKIQFLILALLTSTFLLAGCGANWHAVKHEFDATKESISVDAKQRAIISNKVETPEGDDTKFIARICAEPSPDAISALATSIGASGDLTGEKVDAALKLQFALSQSETAAYIGLRTPTIQLLRDSMYRICEGYMSGALDKGDFKRLHRRYQNLMLGLLSVEQLTRAAVAPQLAISAGAASANIAPDEATRKQIADAYIEAKTNKVAAALAQADADKEVAESAANIKTITDSNKGKTAEELKKLLETPTLELGDKAKKQADAQAAYKKATERENLYARAFDRSVLGITTSAGDGASPGGVVVPATEGLSAEYLAGVGESVKGIVDTIVKDAFGQEECFLMAQDYLKNTKDSQKAQGFTDGANTLLALVGGCLQAQAAQTKLSALNEQIKDKQSELAKEKRKPTKDIDTTKVKKLEDELKNIGDSIKIEDFGIIKSK